MCTFFLEYIMKNKYIKLAFDEAKKAYRDRDRYVKLKQDIKGLKEEEKKLRKAIAIYG